MDINVSFKFWSKLPWHPPCKHFVILNLLWIMSCAEDTRCTAVSLTVNEQFFYRRHSIAAIDSGVITRCAWPGCRQSVAELMPFWKLLLYSYTCWTDSHALLYLIFICQLISLGVTPSVIKTWIIGHCSSLVHDISGAAIFKLWLWFTLFVCTVMAHAWQSWQP